MVRAKGGLDGPGLQRQRNLRKIRERHRGSGAELQASGQDDYPENETAFAYSEMEFDDFDAQSEQLDGYDQEYIKISTDPFRGRFVSAFLAGDVSVHYETVNCAMYQRVSCPEGVIGFGLSLAQPESVVNGLKLGRDDVLITRPGAELELDVSPRGGIFLLLSIKLRMLEPLICTDSILEYLDPDRRKMSVVRAACMASSLEAGGMAILQACAKAPDTWRPHGAASALVAKTVSALGLDMRLGTARERTRDKQSTAVFTATRGRSCGPGEVRLHDAVRCNRKFPKVDPVGLRRTPPDAAVQVFPYHQPSPRAQGAADRHGQSVGDHRRYRCDTRLLALESIHAVVPPAVW